MLRGFTEPKNKELGTPFFKMAGGGNDFVVIDNRSGAIQAAEELALRVCTRRLSVGADGLILIEPSARATFRMRYFNSDGSAADFCANGTRCAARFAFLNVIAPRKMSIETGAGIVGAEIAEQNVTLSLGSPVGFRPHLPLILRDGTPVEGSFIKVGVPHYVVFVREGLWRHDIEALGRALRHHPELAPEGANVNFVTVTGPQQISLRTYERGVEGETLSCGSGITASVAVSALFGRVQSPVSVLTRSGITLSVAFEREESYGSAHLRDVRLTGDARVVYKGDIGPETIRGFDAAWVRNPTEQAPQP